MRTYDGESAKEQSAADDLRDMLSRPLFNPVLKTTVGDGSLDYEVYVRTKELLSLQTSAELLTDPDELMFQVVHQAQEVWLKLLSHELTEIVGPGPSAYVRSMVLVAPSSAWCGIIAVGWPGTALHVAPPSVLR